MDDMKVWYLDHSGYAVETGGCLLVFDYWNDEPTGEYRSLANGVFDPAVWLAEAVRHTATGTVPPVIVFSTHKHGDHFNPIILEWQNTDPAIRYILSHDIPKRHFAGMLKEDILEAGNPQDGNEAARIVRMKAHETHSWPELDLLVHTFRSTDAGVAFWVEIGGKTIYHAGDLNLWFWEGESKAWNNNMKARYAQEIAHIKEWSVLRERTPDVAFLVADPRLSTHWLDGFRQYLKEIAVKAAFPMHFGPPEALRGMREDLQTAPDADTRWIDALHLPTRRGESFML